MSNKNRIFHYLKEYGRTSIKRLGKDLGIKPNSLSRTLKNMESNNFVIRTKQSLGSSGTGGKTYQKFVALKNWKGGEIHKTNSEIHTISNDSEIRNNNSEIHDLDSEIHKDSKELPKNDNEIPKTDSVPIKITSNLIGIDKKAFLEIVKENNPKVYNRLMGKDKYLLNTLILSIQEYLNLLNG